MEPRKNSEYLILMGVNKKFLQELKKLKEEYSEKGRDEFIKKYQKADVFIGPSESINFLEKVLKSKKSK